MHAHGARMVHRAGPRSTKAMREDRVLRRTRTPPATWLAVFPLMFCLLACSRAAPPRLDASASMAPEDATASTATERRRRRRTRVASARGARAMDPASARNDRSAEESLEEAAPRERPRITETGPLLPEDLGRAPNIEYDMNAGAGEGPMGLDEGQIARAMNPLLGRLGTCAEATTDDQGRGPRGRVTVRLRIRPDGTPAAARVSGGGGPPEFVTCVRRVVASARFPRFQGPDVMATWGFDVD